MVCLEYQLTKLSKLNNTLSSDKAISNPKATLPSPQHRLSWPGDKAGAPHTIGPGFEFLCKVVFIAARQAQFVGRRSVCRAGEATSSNAGRSKTQGFEITEENVSTGFEPISSVLALYQLRCKEIIVNCLNCDYNCDDHNFNVNPYFRSPYHQQSMRRKCCLCNVGTSCWLLVERFFLFPFCQSKTILRSANKAFVFLDGSLKTKS